MQNPAVEAVSQHHRQICSPTRLSFGRSIQPRMLSLYYTTSIHTLILNHKSRKRNVARHLRTRV
jgi:hypothetical protein